MRYIRKTNRAYGAVFKTVRNALRRRLRVTGRDFVPGLTLNQAASALWELRQRGEVVMVQRNRQGRGGHGAVYTKSRQQALKPVAGVG